LSPVSLIFFSSLTPSALFFPLSLHDALPISSHLIRRGAPARQLRKVSHLTVAGGAASRQNDVASAGAALALPLVILAPFLLVLFHLSFQVAACFLAACAHRGGFAGGAKGPRRQRKRQGAAKYLRVGVHRKPAMQLDQVGGVAL